MRARAVRTAVAALGDGWRSFDELVRMSTLPRRTLEELLDALADDVERDGTAVRLRPGSAPRHLDRVGMPATPPGDARAAIARHIDEGPPPLAALDHVQATAETVLDRARWLDEQYDLREAELLFLGDHDLTSLAVHLLRPQARLTVVDVDDRVLEHLDRRGDGHIRTVHADLRFGLPLAVTRTADVVFSDPPYTQEGMSLFAARALECLRDPPEGRIVLAYGYSDRHPTLGARVQRALLGLGLTFEAILPAFHRYDGAQAIGGAADLYVCAPTARARKKATSAQTIYTHGPRSVEATHTSDALREAVTALAAEGGREVEWRSPDWTSPGAAPRAGTAVAADLTGDPGPWLLRVLMGINAERVAVLLPNAHPDLADAAGQRALRELLAPKYRLRLLRSTPDNTHAVVVADAVAPGGTAAQQAVHRVWTRAHARLRNLVPDLPAHLADLRAIDLPRHELVRLRSALATDPDR
ncbi:bis-aminopropyl spermidine synthase family protein [Saccharomonospora saliphila]|uniref:bis-aminopropyl spermidine synthase family protein n=1 Tax=Saccharomonospora saliphila TaxID=369829 RepID=UPI0006623AA2|nr:bis-aminopropyl spermidine synthase family protein [Saccharomonospora saliphila]